MNNWRLLLLAFLAVLQPIASFTERNLVDGREQCCDRNSLLRDSRLSYGTFRSYKPSEDRRLSRNVVREDRRYEVRKADAVLIRPSAERRVTDIRSERGVSRLSSSPAWFARAEFRQQLVDSRDRTVDQERRTRDAQRVYFRDIGRDMRSRDVARERSSRHSAIRHNRDVREVQNKATRENIRITRNLEREESRSRISMDSRRETRWNRENSREIRQAEEIRETRNVLRRTRDDVARRESSQDRRVRERTENRRARSESRLHLDNNRERRSLNSRSRENIEDLRRSYRDVRSANRVNNLRGETSRDMREIETEPLHSDSRRHVGERFDERHLNRENSHIARDRTSVRRAVRERSLEERRGIRESFDRSRNNDHRLVRSERTDARKGTRMEDRRSYNRENRDVSDTSTVEFRRTLAREVRDRDVVLERWERHTPGRSQYESRRDVRRTRSVDSQNRIISSEQMQIRTTKNMERGHIDSRIRSYDVVRNRISVDAGVREKTLTESSGFNWQYAFYTLQGIYLCGILTNIVSNKESDKKHRGLTWWAAPRSLVKVD